MPKTKSSPNLAEWLYIDIVSTDRTGWIYIDIVTEHPTLKEAVKNHSTVDHIIHRQDFDMFDALYYALQYNYINLVTDLVTMGSGIFNMYSTFFINAVQHDQYARAIRLLKVADYIHKSITVDAHLSKRSKNRFVKHLLNLLLQIASRDGLRDDVSYLIKKGANVRSNNSTALFLATRNNHNDIVRLLIVKGAK
jgi:hypothetical protein